MTGGIQDQRNTVQERRVQDRRDAEQERCWTGGMQDWRDAGLEGCRKGRMQNRFLGMCMCIISKHEAKIETTNIRPKKHYFSPNPFSEVSQKKHFLKITKINKIKSLRRWWADASNNLYNVLVHIVFYIHVIGDVMGNYKVRDLHICRSLTYIYIYIS